MFKVIIYASYYEQYLSLLEKLKNISIDSDSVIWADSKQRTRVSYINEYLNCWLLFLDHDCFLSSENYLHIVKIISENKTPENSVYTGVYRNPEKSCYLQRAHNFIANIWLEHSYSHDNENKLLLGGVFLIFSTYKIINYENTLFWGAEDKALAYELNKLKFNFYFLPELRVAHETNSSFLHFIRRAYLHGVNDEKFINSNLNKLNYLFWIRKVGFANLYLLPAILLHFCIQKGAKLTQKIPRMSKQKT